MGLGTKPIFLRLAPGEEALAGPRPFSIGRFYLAAGPFRFYAGVVYGQAAHEVRVILVRRD